MKDVARNLELEARSAQALVIWTDCDREGENIGYEIVQVCQKVNPRLEVWRARFSVVQARYIRMYISFKILVQIIYECIRCFM